MEILGIGPMELILILIVALMVFGPDKLPQIGAKLGRGMRDMRRATRAISDEINSTRAAVEGPVRELAEPLQDVAEAAKGASAIAAAARNPGRALRDSVMRELNTPVKPEAAGEEAAAEEHTIAPPQLSGQGQEGAVTNEATPITEPVPSLPEPVVPVAALPAAEEPAPHSEPAAHIDPEAQPTLPGLDQPTQRLAPETSDTAPEEGSAEPLSSKPSEMDADDRRVAKTTDPLAPTSPEQ